VPNLRTSLLVLCILVSASHAQEPAVKAPSQAAKPPHATRIVLSLGSGMCYGYCNIELEVDPGEAILHVRSRESDKKKCPDLKVTASLSNKHWTELAQSIDHGAVFKLPDSVGCPGCVDQVIEGIEIRFSDRTTKDVEFNEGSAPTELTDLSARLVALHEKLSKELPPTTRCSF